MNGRTTLTRVNTEGLTKNQLDFIENLNIQLYYSENAPKKSIMCYEQLCNCDDGFLCEHRLQYIIDYLKLNNK